MGQLFGHSFLRLGVNIVYALQPRQCTPHGVERGDYPHRYNVESGRKVSATLESRTQAKGYMKSLTLSQWRSCFLYRIAHLRLLHLPDIFTTNQPTNLT
jgi:hypothetical protein